jgi:hypothetical protein
MVIRSTLFCLLIRRITHVLFKTIIMYEYFEIRGPVGPGREISEDINIGLFIALCGRGGGDSSWPWSHSGCMSVLVGDLAVVNIVLLETRQNDTNIS